MQSFGWIDLNLVYINPIFLTSAIIGGVIMGLGFVISGFCPGTSVCSAATGRIDAYFFILGVFIGITFFTEGFTLFKTLYESQSLGNLKISKVLNLTDGQMALLIVLAASVVFYIAEKVEQKVGASKQEVSHVH